MTVFRLWSAVSSITAKPLPSATCDWWQWCDDCHHLSGPHADEHAATDATHECRHRTVTPRTSYRTWTPADDDVIATHGPAEAARLLRATVGQVAGRRKTLIAAGRIAATHGGVRRGARA
jgi:hypothetical protein